MTDNTLSTLPTFNMTSTADLAAAGFLARYSGKTRESYQVTLKILWQWCATHSLPVLDARTINY